MVWSIGGKAKSDPTIEVASVRGTPKSIKITREKKTHSKNLFTFSIVAEWVPEIRFSGSRNEPKNGLKP